MNKFPTTTTLLSSAIGSALLLPSLLLAQVPVDQDGNEIGQFESYDETVVDSARSGDALDTTRLEELVGPVALYPDDLLAIVLPASAYPLQIASASRFLEKLESDPSLKPNPEWDDSVVALTNYPEIIELMNDDLDWTYRLGEAVVGQQEAVIAAVESFRDRAYTAGNLKSDDHQTVSYDDGVIEIEPVDEDVIYVPYYEPRRVVVYQPRPVYYYHPHAYPVYYYPYSAGHYFDRGRFWGVTTAFSIGWFSDSLHVYHHSYHGHPYYGRHYRNNWWYRRPSISVYNTTYVNNNRYARSRDGYNNRDRNRQGDRWHPRDSRRTLVSNTRHTGTAGQTTVRTQNARTVATTRQRDPISFRERRERGTTTARTEREPVVNRSRGDRNSETRTQRRDTQSQNRREETREQTNRQQTNQRDQQTRESHSRERREQSPNTAQNSGQSNRREQIQFRDRSANRQAGVTARVSAQRERTTQTSRQQRREPVNRAPARTQQPVASERRRASSASSSSARNAQRSAAPAARQATPERRTESRQRSNPQTSRRSSQQPSQRQSQQSRSTSTSKSKGTSRESRGQQREQKSSRRR